MSTLQNEFEQKLQHELILLKQRLNASVFFIEIIRPTNRTEKWVVSNTDIVCFGQTNSEETIFEFNFTDRLANYATIFFQNKSVRAGGKFWLSPDNLLQFQELTAATADEERQRLIQELSVKNEQHREVWKNNLSNISFGKDLANAVVIRLLQHPLCFQHRDYCGTGLFYINNKFIYCEVEDGEPVTDYLIQFEDQIQFAEWLARQSDYSMARLDEVEFKQGNQTITKSRLNAFTKGS